MYHVSQLHVLQILLHSCFLTIYVGNFDVVNIRDVTAESEIKNFTILEFEFDSSISLSTSLGYYLELSWNQVNGNRSGVAVISSCWASNASNDTQYNGQLERIGRSGTYRLSVPKQLLGEGRLMVNMTVNLFCNYYFSDCYCSRWHVQGSSASVEISSKWR